uniref:Uncharacterized protein n=1 Tax=Glossina brevipalpis TaxID=37001 RepID=A0A1A9WMU7_9MUSC
MEEINKNIVDTQGNNRIISESTPDLSQNQPDDMDQNFNIENQSTSSGSSVEPRSDCSYSEMDRILNNQVNKPAESSLDAGRESTMSDYLAGHTVPLPDLSNVPTESEEDDFVSVTSSAKGEGTWEHNWLFKKKHSSLGGSGTTASILIPNPKEDVRAQIGDKAADEVSDLSELGSETDDSSSGLLSTKLDPLNDRLLNKHIIGGQNSKSVLDELIESSSVVLNAVPSEQDETYTDTLNEHVVDAPPKNEAINDEISKPETIDTELERKPSTECETEDVEIPAEGCLGFSEVEVIDPSERTPSVIEILAAVALAPMLAVPAADQPATLTTTELSTLHELTDLALTEIKTRAGEITAHDLEVISEEPTDTPLQGELLIDLKNLPPPPALDDISTDYIIENLILKPPDEVAEIVTYIPIVEPPPKIEQKSVESEQTNAEAIASKTETSSVNEESQLLDTAHSEEQIVLNACTAVEENQSLDKTKSNLPQVAEGNVMSPDITKSAISEEIATILEIQQTTVERKQDLSSIDVKLDLQSESAKKEKVEVSEKDLTSTNTNESINSKSIPPTLEVKETITHQKQDRSSKEMNPDLQLESLVKTEAEIASSGINGSATCEAMPVKLEVEEALTHEKEDRPLNETVSDIRPESTVIADVEVAEKNFTSSDINNSVNSKNILAKLKEPDRSSDNVKLDLQPQSVMKAEVEVSKRNLTSTNTNEPANFEPIPATLEIEETIARENQDQSSNETQTDLQLQCLVKAEAEIVSPDVNEPATHAALEVEETVTHEKEDRAFNDKISDLQTESTVKRETEVAKQDFPSSNVNNSLTSEAILPKLEVEAATAQENPNQSSDDVNSDLQGQSERKTEVEVSEKVLTSANTNESVNSESIPVTLEVKETIALDQSSNETKTDLKLESLVKTEAEIATQNLTSPDINNSLTSEAFLPKLEIEETMAQDGSDQFSDDMKLDLQTQSVMTAKIEVSKNDSTSTDINESVNSESIPPTLEVEETITHEKQNQSSNKMKPDLQLESVVKIEAEIVSSDINESTPCATIPAKQEVEGTLISEKESRTLNETMPDLQLESMKMEIEIAKQDLTPPNINNSETSEAILAKLEAEETETQEKPDRSSVDVKLDLQSEFTVKAEVEEVLTSTDIKKRTISEPIRATLEIEEVATHEKEDQPFNEAISVLKLESVMKTELEIAKQDFTSPDINNSETSEAILAKLEVEEKETQEKPDRSSDDVKLDFQPESVIQTEVKVSKKNVTSADIDEPVNSKSIPVTLEVEGTLEGEKQEQRFNETKSDLQLESVVRTEAAEKNLTSPDINNTETHTLNQDTAKEQKPLNFLAKSAMEMEMDKSGIPEAILVKKTISQEKQDESPDEIKPVSGIVNDNMTSQDTSKSAISDTAIEVLDTAPDAKEARSYNETKSALQPEFSVKTEAEGPKKDLTSIDINNAVTPIAILAKLEVDEMVAQEKPDQSSDETKSDLQSESITNTGTQVLEQNLTSLDINNSATIEASPSILQAIVKTEENIVEENVACSDANKSGIIKPTEETTLASREVNIQNDNGTNFHNLQETNYETIIQSTVDTSTIEVGSLELSTPQSTDNASIDISCQEKKLRQTENEMKTKSEIYEPNVFVQEEKENDVSTSADPKDQQKDVEETFTSQLSNVELNQLETEEVNNIKEILENNRIGQSLEQENLINKVVECKQGDFENDSDLHLSKNEKSPKAAAASCPTSATVVQSELENSDTKTDIVSEPEVQEKLLKSSQKTSTQAFQLTEEKPELSEKMITSANACKAPLNLNPLNIERKQVADSRMHVSIESRSDILKENGFNEENKTHTAAEKKQSNENNVEKKEEENEIKVSSENPSLNMEEKVKTSETIRNAIDQFISTKDDPVCKQKPETLEIDRSHITNLNVEDETLSVAQKESSSLIEKFHHPRLDVIEGQNTITETFAISIEESNDATLKNSASDGNIFSQTSSCPSVETQREECDEGIAEPVDLKVEEIPIAPSAQHIAQEVLEKSQNIIENPEEKVEATVLSESLEREESKGEEEATTKASIQSIENVQSEHVTIKDEFNLEVDKHSFTSLDVLIPPPAAFKSEYVLKNQNHETPTNDDAKGESSDYITKQLNLCLCEDRLYQRGGHSLLKSETTTNTTESPQTLITESEIKTESLKVVEEKTEKISQISPNETTGTEEVPKVTSAIVSTETIAPIIDNALTDSSVALVPQAETTSITPSTETAPTLPWSAAVSQDTPLIDANDTSVIALAQKAEVASTMTSNEITVTNEISSRIESHETIKSSETSSNVGAVSQDTPLIDANDTSVIAPAQKAEVTSIMISNGITITNEISSRIESHETIKSSASTSIIAVSQDTPLIDANDTSVTALANEVESSTNIASNEITQKNEISLIIESRETIPPSETSLSTVAVSQGTPLTDANDTPVTAAANEVEDSTNITSSEITPKNEISSTKESRETIQPSETSSSVATVLQNTALNDITDISSQETRASTTSASSEITRNTEVISTTESSEKVKSSGTSPGAATVLNEGILTEIADLSVITPAQEEKIPSTIDSIETITSNEIISTAPDHEKIQFSESLPTSATLDGTAVAEDNSVTETIAIEPTENPMETEISIASSELPIETAINIKDEMSSTSVNESISINMCASELTKHLPAIFIEETVSSSPLEDFSMDRTETELAGSSKNQMSEVSIEEQPSPMKSETSETAHIVSGKEHVSEVSIEEEYPQMKSEIVKTTLVDSSKDQISEVSIQEEHTHIKSETVTSLSAILNESTKFSSINKINQEEPKLTDPMTPTVEIISMNIVTNPISASNNAAHVSLSQTLTQEPVETLSTVTTASEKKFLEPAKPSTEKVLKILSDETDENHIDILAEPKTFSEITTLSQQPDHDKDIPISADTSIISENLKTYSLKSNSSPTPTILKEKTNPEIPSNSTTTSAMEDTVLKITEQHSYNTLPSKNMNEPEKAKKSIEGIRTPSFENSVASKEQIDLKKLNIPCDSTESEQKKLNVPSDTLDLEQKSITVSETATSQLIANLLSQSTANPHIFESMDAVDIIAPPMMFATQDIITNVNTETEHFVNIPSAPLGSNKISIKPLEESALACLSDSYTIVEPIKMKETKEASRSIESTATSTTSDETVIEVLNVKPQQAIEACQSVANEVKKSSVVDGDPAHLVTVTSYSSSQSSKKLETDSSLAENLNQCPFPADITASAQLKMSNGAIESNQNSEQFCNTEMNANAIGTITSLENKPQLILDPITISSKVTLETDKNTFSETNLKSGMKEKIFCEEKKKFRIESEKISTESYRDFITPLKPTEAGEIPLMSRTKVSEEEKLQSTLSKDELQISATSNGTILKKTRECESVDIFMSDASKSSSLATKENIQDLIVNVLRETAELKSNSHISTQTTIHVEKEVSECTITGPELKSTFTFNEESASLSKKNLSELTLTNKGEKFTPISQILLKQRETSQALTSEVSSEVSKPDSSINRINAENFVEKISIVRETPSLVSEVLLTTGLNVTPSSKYTMENFSANQIPELISETPLAAEINVSRVIASEKILTAPGQELPIVNSEALLATGVNIPKTFATKSIVETCSTKEIPLVNMEALLAPEINVSQSIVANPLMETSPVKVDPTLTTELFLAAELNVSQTIAAEGKKETPHMNEVSVLSSEVFVTPELNTSQIIAAAPKISYSEKSQVEQTISQVIDSEIEDTGLEIKDSLIQNLLKRKSIEKPDKISMSNLIVFSNENAKENLPKVHEKLDDSSSRESRKITSVSPIVEVNITGTPTTSTEHKPCVKFKENLAEFVVSACNDAESTSSVESQPDYKVTELNSPNTIQLLRAGKERSIWNATNAKGKSLSESAETIEGEAGSTIIKVTNLVITDNEDPSKPTCSIFDKSQDVAVEPSEVKVLSDTAILSPSSIKTNVMNELKTTLASTILQESISCSQAPLEAKVEIDNKMDKIETQPLKTSIVMDIVDQATGAYEKFQGTFQTKSQSEKPTPIIEKDSQPMPAATGADLIAECKESTSEGYVPLTTSAATVKDQFWHTNETQEESSSGMVINEIASTRQDNETVEATSTKVLSTSLKKTIEWESAKTMQTVEVINAKNLGNHLVLRKLCRQACVSSDTAPSLEDDSQETKKSPTTNALGNICQQYIQDKRLLAALETRRRQTLLMHRFLSTFEESPHSSMENELIAAYQPTVQLPDANNCYHPISPIGSIDTSSINSEDSSICDCDNSYLVGEQQNENSFHIFNNILFSDQITNEYCSSNNTPTTDEEIIEIGLDVELEHKQTQLNHNNINNNTYVRLINNNGIANLINTCNNKHNKNNNNNHNKNNNNDHHYYHQHEHELTTSIREASAVEVTTQLKPEQIIVHNNNNKIKDYQDDVDNVILEKEEHIDDMTAVQPKFVPGSIAEREYLKWHNAVDMPNNPYAPEALRKRINGSEERCMDLPNISPDTAVITI